MKQKCSLTEWFRSEGTTAWVDNWLRFDQGRRNGTKLALKKLRRLRFYEIARETNCTILELGCGTGGFLQVLSDLGYKRVFGIELIEQFIRHASNRDKIVNASCTCLPVRSNNADLIISVDTLHHLYPQELDQCVLEVRRVLKDGGYWLIREPRDSIGEKAYTYFTQRLIPARKTGFFGYMRKLKLQEWPVYQAWLNNQNSFFTLLNKYGFQLQESKDLINFYLVCKLKK